MGKTYLIAIVGGSHSGKSALAQTLMNAMKAAQLPWEIAHVNEADYQKQTREKAVEYDYTRLAEDLKYFMTQEGLHLVLVEGFYLLHRSEIRNLFQEKLFIELDDETRLERKVKKSTEKGFLALDAYKEFQKVDRPLYEHYIAPGKAQATWLIDGKKLLLEANKFAEYLQQKLRENQ